MDNNVNELLKSTDTILNQFEEENTIDYIKLEEIIVNLSNIVNVLKENETFIELNEELNEYLNEFMESIQRNDVKELNYIYKYKIKDIIQEC